MDFIIYFVAAIFLVFVALEAWLIRRWAGVWRFVAALPLVALLLMIGKIVLDVRNNPTSHNLWPIELIIYGAYAVGALLLIAIIKGVFAVSNRDKEVAGNG